MRLSCEPSFQDFEATGYRFGLLGAVLERSDTGH